MGNCLILITKKYPFETGEEFIENEIAIVANSFKKVIIIATSVSGVPIKTRSVPKNTDVYYIDANEIKKRIISSSFKLLPFSKLKKISGQKEYNFIHHSFTKRMFLLYFAAKSELVYKKCANILNRYSLGQYSKVVFYSYWFYDTALAAVKLRDNCTANEKSAVCRAHRYDLYHEQSRVGYIPLRRYILKNIDKVFPCSNDGSDYLKKLYPEFAGKIKTAYLGTKDFGVSPYAAGGAFRIVSCCHISPVKRVEMLAHSLYLLKDSGMDLQWTHFGGGDGFDSLKEYASENLTFMKCTFPGEIKNSELMKYYMNTPVSCFINTSSSEGLPVSIMEACSFGIPAVATDVGGTSEIVRDGKNGFLLKNDFSENDLAEKIKLLYSMSEKDTAKLRSSSRAVWLENFSCNRNYIDFAKEITR